MNPKIGRSIGKLGVTFKKNLPTITTVLSAIGVVGTGVLAARAAYKSCQTIEEHKDLVDQLHANKECFETEKEYNKEVVAVYKNTTIDLAKVYWPAFVAGGLTIAGIFTTNNIHRNRYFTMAGMYTAAVSAYKEYRKRVSDKYGEDAERDLFYNIKREEVVTVETDKKGKEKTKVEVVTKPGPIDDPNYDIIRIERGDKIWYAGLPESTYYRFLNVQSNMTQLLRTRGFVFLNEVLDALELPMVPMGQIIGWVYDESKSETDNCVDFGLKEGTENFDFFMSGKNEFVYLELNHDGTMYDKFPDFDRMFSRNVPRRI